MYKVKVYITLKEGVLDPQGHAVKGALHSMDYKEVEGVRIGKYMELNLSEAEGDINKKVEEMCERLLANPVIENYRYEVEEVVSQ